MELTIKRLITIKYPSHYKKDIAKILMYSDEYFNRILNGKTPIKHQVYIRILRLLEVGVDELLQCKDVNKFTLLKALEELDMEEEYRMVYKSISIKDRLTNKLKGGI